MNGRRQLLAFVVARAGGRVLRALPEPLVRRIAPGAATASPSRPLAELIPDTAVRLLIGPANSAGQAGLWGRALERRRAATGVVAMAVQPPGRGFGFAVDQTVPLARYRWSREWAREQRATVVDGFTHVLAESGRQLFGDASASAYAELAGLRAAGLRIGLVFHGSDLRSPRRHAASSPWSPYRDWDLTPTLALRVRENLALARRLGAPVFVTTPDLLDELAGARWLPVVVDVSAWAAPTTPLSGERIVVAHAPSSARIKGTELIEPVLRRLETEGLLDYRRIEGVPSGEMPAQYATVDVVLDQFRLGAYGVAAVEALAAGRVVIAHVSPAVREQVATATGLQLPVVEADASTLEGVLRGIAADRARFRSIAETGPAFAAAVHGGDLSADVLGGFLDA